MKKDNRYYGVYNHINSELLGEYLKTLTDANEINSLIFVGSYKDMANNVSFASMNHPTFLYTCDTLDEVWTNSEEYNYVFIDGVWFEIVKPTDTIVLIKLGSN